MPTKKSVALFIGRFQPLGGRRQPALPPKGSPPKGSRKPVALFIGRFQPFHRGHLAALKWIAARSSRVIVAIGSAQKSFEPGNPFSASERRRMILGQLKAAGISRKCRLVLVTDINDNGKWAAHVDASVPAYESVYSNNALVRRLMKKAGKEVLPVPFFSKERFNATRIRERMKGGKQWADRVPPKVRQQLEKLHAEERLRKI